MFNSIKTLFLFSLVMPLMACHTTYDFAKNSKTPALQPNHRIAIETIGNEDWIENLVENDFGAMVIANNVGKYDKQVTTAWFHLESLSDFLDLSAENAAIHQVDTGCVLEMIPILESKNSMVYEERVSNCPQRAGNYQTYSKAFLATDGIYTITVALLDETLSEETRDAYREAVVHSTLLKLTPHEQHTLALQRLSAFHLG